MAQRLHLLPRVRRAARPLADATPVGDPAIGAADRLSPKAAVRNAQSILTNRRVALLILATGLVFGAQLLSLSTAADLFFDAYGIEENFPLYFALLATSIGLVSFLNAKLVQRFGMDAMARAGFLVLALAGLAMLSAVLAFDGYLPLTILLALTYAAFFAIGILFGNLKAMAMRPLGQVAGLAASLIASGSSLIATDFAVAMGRFYDGTPLNLACGLFIAGALPLILAELSARSSVVPVEVTR